MKKSRDSRQQDAPAAAPAMPSHACSAPGLGEASGLGSGEGLGSGQGLGEAYGLGDGEGLGFGQFAAWYA